MWVSWIHTWPEREIRRPQPIHPHPLKLPDHIHTFLDLSIVVWTTIIIKKAYTMRPHLSHVVWSVATIGKIFWGTQNAALARHTRKLSWSMLQSTIPAQYYNHHCHTGIEGRIIRVRLSMWGLEAWLLQVWPAFFGLQICLLPFPAGAHLSKQ